MSGVLGKCVTDWAAQIARDTGPSAALSGIAAYGSIAATPTPCGRPSLTRSYAGAAPNPIRATVCGYARGASQMLPAYCGRRRGMRRRACVFVIEWTRRRRGFPLGGIAIAPPFLCRRCVPRSSGLRLSCAIAREGCRAQPVQHPCFVQTSCYLPSSGFSELCRQSLFQGEQCAFSHPPDNRRTSSYWRVFRPSFVEFVAT